MQSRLAPLSLLVSLSAWPFLACSDPDAPVGPTGPTAGTSAAGSPTAGTTSSGGMGGSAAGTSATTAGSGGAPVGGGGAGGTAAGGGGAGGTAAGGSAGAGGSGGATGGSGGSAGAGGSGGSGGAAGGSGGSGGSGGAMPTAVANITGVNSMNVTGTATFKQGATMTTLELKLTACPDGAHGVHLHAMKDCGNNGAAAGDHWVPNGEGLPDLTCANNMGMFTFMKPTSEWTVGDPSGTDVTKYSIIVHAMGGGSPGGRSGCGLINKQ